MKRAPQQGVVLVVALIMMAVIAVSSAIALRGAMSQDIVAVNQRSRSMASQAAEAALRYCEASITATNMSAAQALIKRAPPVAAEELPFWARPDSWTGGTGFIYVVQIPKAFQFDGSNAVYNRQPECMIQELSLSAMPSQDRRSPRPEAFAVTSRGFSPDYAESGNNTPVAGAVVWLQSTVQINP